MKLISSHFTKIRGSKWCRFRILDYYKKYAIPLLFQAKKAILMYDGYLKKLNYKAKEATHKQYQLLKSYAKSKGLSPYYLIYAID